MSFDYFSKRRMQYILEKLKNIFDTKVDKVSGKGLSTEDYTTTEKNKLSGIATGAEVNVQSDWNQTTTTADDYIKNKPTSKAAASGGTDVSLVTTGEKYTWNNKSNLALGTSSSTAFRGDYGNSAYAHAVTNKGSAFANGLYKITTNSEGHVTAATAVAKADITALGIPGSDTNNRKSFYGTCDTAAATAAKVVTISDTNGWELRAGTIIGVKFTNDNTANNVTLNVNNSGAKSIFYNNAVYTAAANYICGVAGKIIYYMYDGTNWAWINFNWHSDGNDKVAQTATSTNSDYEVLFSGTADNTTRTEGARKYSNLKFNPSTGNLQATQLNGVTIGSSPKFTDTNTWRGIQDNLTSSTNTTESLSAKQGYLLANGSARDSTKVAKSGDTMTGDLTIAREGTTANNYPSMIYFKPKDTTTGQQYAYSYLAAYNDHVASTAGTNMVLQSGGGMFFGSGESPGSHYSAKGASYTGEDTFLTSDGTTHLQSNGNTIANRVGFQVNTSGYLIPEKADAATNGIGGLGNSSYRVKDIYSMSFNELITGSGTAAQDKGSRVSPRYFPAKWTFNIGRAPVDGDIITIKIPVAGHDYGVFVSINNGTNYHPVRVDYGTGRLTTHYGNGQYISLIYTPNATVNDVFAVNGADARSNITGCWTVLNYRDTNTDIRAQAYCDTAAATAAKVASSTNYRLRANSYILLNLVYANSVASALTLNVNNQGAKPIYINGSASSATNYTLPAGTYFVFYNGTNYYFRTDSWAITGNILGTANATNYINSNSRMDYNWNGVNYFNANLTAGHAAKANDSPTTAWWHILRFNHGNSAGFYTDLAIPFNDTSLYYKRITNGAVQNNGWVKVYDALNLTSKAAAASGTDLSLVTTGEKATWNAKGSGTVTQVKVGTTAYNPSSGVISLPAYPTNTDEKVSQSWTSNSESTYNNNYGVLMTSTAYSSTSRTNGTRYSSGLNFNPYKGSLKISKDGTGNASATEEGSLAHGICINNGYITASGKGSFAGGYSYVPNGYTASSPNAGTEIIASGEGSIAHGFVTLTNTTKTGIYASGSGSIAVGRSDGSGRNITASGTGAIAAGYAVYGGVTASNTAALAHGSNVSASGAYSRALGYSVTANLNSQTVIGYLSPKFSTVSVPSKGDGFAFGMQQYPQVYASNSSVDGSYGCSGEITGTATVTISVKPYAVYLLFVNAIKISDGSSVGSTIRYIIGRGNASSVNTQISSIWQSETAPASISGTKGYFTIKNSGSANATEFSLVRIM